MVIVPDKNIIRLVRGDTGMMSITVTDEATGEEVTDYIGKFTLKRELRDNVFALQKTIIEGEIAFEHDDTQTMDFGNYYYDIQITSGGQVQTFGPNLFQLLPDVTTR
jgi:hypothetical protein